ncbi:MAG: FAD-dependent oxidoreductase [Pseudomonadales bacterium]
MISRRTALTTLAAAPLIGCGRPPSSPYALGRAYSRQPWAVPQIDRGNVIREIVGHRPYRASGFVVRAEPFDDKLVVHNYGHGGGGISLSWGSSALAVRELGDRPPGQAAVVGSGVMGLTSARLLQDAGWQVTIYTRSMARHTTSNVAGGEWGPFSVYNPDAASPEFVARLGWAARVAHHAYTSLGGEDYGIRWLEHFALSDSPPAPALSGGGEDFADLMPYSADLPPGSHPFGNLHARRSVTMMIEPARLLRSLVRDFQLAGGRFVIRDFGDVGDVLGLEEAVIFNCTGLGAAALFGDTELIPAKGQLVLLPPDPAIDYLTTGGGRGLLYLFPRSDVLLLGGTFKPGDGSTHPEPEETERILSEHVRLFEAFRAT